MEGAWASPKGGVGGHWTESEPGGTPHQAVSTHLSGGKTEAQRTPAPYLETSFGPPLPIVRLNRRRPRGCRTSPEPGTQSWGAESRPHGHGLGHNAGDSLTCTSARCPAWPTEVAVSVGHDLDWLLVAELGLGHPGRSRCGRQSLTPGQAFPSRTRGSWCPFREVPWTGCAGPASVCPRGAAAWPVAGRPAGLHYQGSPRRGSKLVEPPGGKIQFSPGRK